MQAQDPSGGQCPAPTPMPFHSCPALASPRPLVIHFHQHHASSSAHSITHSPASQVEFASQVVVCNRACACIIAPLVVPLHRFAPGPQHGHLSCLPQAHTKTSPAQSSPRVCDTTQCRKAPLQGLSIQTALPVQHIY